MGLFGNKKEVPKPFNSIEYMKGMHVSGLPVPEGIWCNIYLHEDKVVLSDGSSMFNLALEKIIGVTIKNEVEIQQAYVSSAGGAVGGAILFGPLGAMIGGRAKKKTTEILSYYLIFTYKKEESVDYISFDVSGFVSDAKKMETAVLSRLRTNTTIIDL